ncbi:hypothetical protein [Chryseobacterium scophthalmum]|uniref:Uncharacterized protein n=1 Tax=Chryseobacterium scophthalmum TaxID=59733 RepID=A0A1N6HS58_9FLAO|nr:hypothetical protein [Chryseobacterium scophthalmum]SIO22570.1 hypothetical protein SAMN05421769_2793 [Chryseobacterium scophthalmum]
MNKSSKIYITGHRGILGSVNLDASKNIGYTNIITATTFAFPFVCKTPKLLAHYIQKFIKIREEVRQIMTGNMQSQPFCKKYIADTYNMPGADLFIFEKLLSK